MKKEKGLRFLILKILAFVFILLLGFCIAGTDMLYRWEIQINQELGIRTSEVVGSDEDDVLYSSDYDDIADLFEDKRALIEEIGSEGAVLLKNENNALPLATGSKISFFGRNSTNLTYGTASGSGTINLDCDDLMTVFTSKGFDVNPTLWSFYTETVTGRVRYSRSGAMQVGEAYLSEYTDEVRASYSQYNDAVFIVITRAFGESFDASTDPSIIRDGDGVHHTLQLQDSERDMISEAKSAAGSTGKVIVLLNSDNPMEIEELKQDDDIDSILWIGGQGVWGLYGVADIITGEVSPSGHLTDTYAVDSTSSPAAQNFGDFQWTNASSVGDWSGAQTYVVYQEGVYVGYKYYETRYEDYVLGQGNADSTTGAFASTGGWNYAEEVSYSFGYGLSYTTFSRTISNLVWDLENETVSVDVTVKNTGDTYSGKDVVQIYVQTPYTDYDIKYNVEKPSVKLIGFEKTSELAPGEEETVTVTAKLEHVASYDYTNAKTYILDYGDYYFACGNGAHDALNNILAARTDLTAEQRARMTDPGDAGQAISYTYNNISGGGEVDSTTCAYSDYNTDVQITNQLDFADINSYDGIDITYLSRNDWQATWTGPLELTATSQMIADFADGATYVRTEESYDTSGIIDGVSYNSTATDWKFADLYGKDYDDPIWEEIVSQLSIEEICMAVAVRNPGGLESIEMPQYMQVDGPAGIISSYDTNNSEYAMSAAMYNMETVLASTFNKELAHREGEMFGNDGLWTGSQSVWASGSDTHRTPFGGRNGEYYSEDGILAYHMGKEFSEGAAEYGLRVAPKHLAFNDQETNRGGVATYTNEQAARELYLRAFEGPMADGAALNTMLGKNRLGSFFIGATPGLITNILRLEWDFQGNVLTDSSTGGYSDGPSSVVAGTTQMDTATLSDYYEDKLSPTAVLQDSVLFEAMKEAVHHNLYLWANTSLMNGLATGTYVTIVPWYQQVIIALDITFGVAAAGTIVAFIVLKLKRKPDEPQEV